MRVAVAVHGRFHGFDLARELRAHGHLTGLLTTYPAFIARQFLPLDLPLATAPLLEVLRRLPLGRPSDVWIARRFARFVARHLPGDLDILVGWSGASLEAMEPARQRGAKVVIERGSSHIAHQAEILAEEHARFRLPFTPVDPAMIARECAEYEAADRISVPTGFARRTFLERGIAEERLAVNPYGVDLSAFAPAARPPGPARPRVLMVGRLGLRKGLPYLLEAARRLGPGVEVRLVGPLDPGAGMLLAAAPDNVVAAGPLPGSALPGEYAAADLFCLPSLEEGLPLTLLQAMACGLPVVVTPETGAADLVTDGMEGVMVPSRDGAALAGALAGLIADPTLRAEMGRAARRRVAAGFGWADYGERAIALYRDLIGETP